MPERNYEFWNFLINSGGDRIAQLAKNLHLINAGTNVDDQISLFLQRQKCILAYLLCFPSGRNCPIYRRSCVRHGLRRSTKLIALIGSHQSRFLIIDVWINLCDHCIGWFFMFYYNWFGCGSGDVKRILESLSRIVIFDSPVTRSSVIYHSCPRYSWRRQNLLCGGVTLLRILRFAGIFVAGLDLIIFKKSDLYLPWGFLVVVWIGSVLWGHFSGLSCPMAAFGVLWSLWCLRVFILGSPLLSPHLWVPCSVSHLLRSPMAVQYPSSSAVLRHLEVPLNRIVLVARELVPL